jgi:glycosyltransferase involved in cell wall biosynthesis
MSGTMRIWPRGSLVDAALRLPSSVESNRGLKVLFVGPRGHGGEEVYVQTLLDNPPRGVEYVDTGSFHGGAPGAPCRITEEVLLNRIVHPWLIPDMGFRSLSLKGHFDLVHVHAHPVRLNNLENTPLVMSEGSSSAVYLQKYIGWDDRAMARGYSRARWVYGCLGIHDRLLNLSRVSRAYVFSQWARDINIRWGADPSKLDVVYPGFPTPAAVERTDRESFTFLFVGTDFERKGGFEVVEAFEAVANRHRHARLVLISANPRVRNPDRSVHSWVPAPRREKILLRLEAMERQGLVERHPLLERSRLYDTIYPKADVFVMPSRAEGFGFTNVEALSFGLPVISSRVGAIPEVVEHGVTGFLVPPGDVSSLATRMERLLADRALARRMGQAARAAFLARFTLEHFRAEVGRIYRAALEGRCAAF